MISSRSFVAVPLASCLVLVSTRLAADAAEPPPAILAVTSKLDTLQAERKLAEAENLIRETLRAPGVEPNHPAVAKLQVRLAAILADANQHAAAATAATAAIPIYEQALGRESLFAIHARWFAARQAMTAGHAADAAALAAPLLACLRDYVASGRAKAAKWEDIPDIQLLLVQIPGLNDAGIGQVAALLGRAWVAAGEIDKAAPVLEEAAQLLQAAHGAGHPDLVAVQQALETVASKRGGDPGRRYVGDLGDTRLLEFAGNLTFPAGQLRSALAKELQFVLASHPAASFADLPPVIRNDLHRGYLAAGFPKSSVEVTRQSTAAGDRLLASIEEGPRYRMGEIRITGAREVDPDKLREKLLLRPPAGPDSQMAALLRKSMLLYQSALPKPDTTAAEAIVDNLNKQLPSARVGATATNIPPGTTEKTDGKWLDFLQSSSQSQTYPDWTPGDPASFEVDQKNPLNDKIHLRLAELGRPLARFASSHDFRDNGRVDLVIEITDEGPVATVGKVEVIGCTRNSPAEVATAAGLTAGAAVTPEMLDKAVVALWNSGRFFPFSIDMQRRNDQARELDFTILAREIPAAPTLAETPAPELECARRFIITLNQWLATGRFTDFLWSFQDPTGKRMAVGLSGRDGLMFAGGDGATGIDLRLSVTQGSLAFDLTHPNHHGCGRLPMPAEHFTSYFHLLADAVKTGSMAVSAGIGASSNARDDGRLAFDLLISPALPMVKPASFRRDGKQVVFSPEGWPELLRLDLASALPVAGSGFTFEARAGIVREHQTTLDAEITANERGDSVIGWLGAVATLLQFKAQSQTAEDDESLGRKIRFASLLLLNPETLKPFKDLYLKWSADQSGKEKFRIPVDPAVLQNSGNMAMLVGLGAISWSEMLAPPDSWVAKLSRELVFIYGGKTQYTARVMDELLADPNMGPYGCQIAAQLLAKLSPETSRRFLAKALAQAHADGFSHDWRLLVDSSLGLGTAVNGCLAALTALSPQTQQAAAELLAPDQAAWFTGFIERLRARPQTQEIAAWIAPQMERLWTSQIQPPLRRRLESALAPPYDPALVAAVVNGQPVPRVLVRAISDGFFPRDGLRAPAADASRPWTNDPALAVAVRIALLRQAAAGRGHHVDYKQVGLLVDRAYAGLKDQPAAKWLETTGMTREETTELFAMSACIQHALTTAMPAAPDAAITEAFYRRNARQLSRQVHLHLIGAAHDSTTSLTKASQATRLVTQISAALDDGLPFYAMKDAANANSRRKLQVLCSGAGAKLNLLDLPPTVAVAIANLKPGQATAPFAINKQSCIARVEAWNDPEPRPFAQVAKSAAVLLHFQQTLMAVDAVCRSLEVNAQVVVLTPGPPASTEPSPLDVWLNDDPDGAVARLGAFWLKAAAGDKSAAAALDELLDSDALKPAPLVLLADALLARDQRQFARRCVAAAADRDGPATRQAIKDALERHRKTGSKGQQEQLEQLLQPPPSAE